MRSGSFPPMSSFFGISPPRYLTRRFGTPAGLNSLLQAITSRFIFSQPRSWMGAAPTPKPQNRDLCADTKTQGSQGSCHIRMVGVSALSQIASARL